METSLPDVGNGALPETAASSARRIDQQGRTLGYLRLSLTTACTMRCTYCRPEIDRFRRTGEELTADECESLARHLSKHYGVHKIRLTGGEPTIRPDLIEIIARLAAIDGIDDLAMTTNGLTLVRDAERLADAGLKRLNVSLDTLDAERFKQLTGVEGLTRVLDGLTAAQEAGLADHRPIRINTVVIRDENLIDLPTIVSYAADHHLEPRFIELMPMGPRGHDWERRYAPEPMMRTTLESIVAEYHPLPQGASAARPFHCVLHDGRTVTVGFITPMSCNFCAACDRIRVGADGALFPCLMDEPRGSLMPALRPAFDAAELDRLIATGYAAKQSEHPPSSDAPMIRIGG